MSCLTAPQIMTKGDGEIIACAVSFLPLLDSGEVLDGTPTATELITSDLTIDNVARCGSITINGVLHDPNQGVVFRVSGGTAGESYTIKVVCSTSADLEQTRVVLCRLDVEDDG